jgi:hypothetical protein
MKSPVGSFALLPEGRVKSTNEDMAVLKLEDVYIDLRKNVLEAVLPRLLSIPGVCRVDSCVQLPSCTYRRIESFTCAGARYSSSGIICLLCRLRGAIGTRASNRTRPSQDGLGVPISRDLHRMVLYHSGKASRTCGRRLVRASSGIHLKRIGLEPHFCFGIVFLKTSLR